MAIAGLGGSVNIGAVKVAEIGAWKLDINADILETTSFDSAGWKEYIAGLKDWAGSFDGTFTPTDTNGQIALQNAIFGGTSLSLKLENGTTNYTGTALLKKQSLDDQVKDVVKVAYDFQGSGALTFAP